MAPTTDPSATRPRALITGATAGLGREFAEQLAASGHNLVLVSRTRERLEQAAAELSARHGVEVEVMPADLADRPQLDRVAARLRDREHAVTMLVNNAGLGLTEPFHRNRIEDERQHLDVLVTAPLHLTHAALEGMLERRHGTILSVSSVAAYSPRGTYGAAKAWVVSFTRWANLEYRRDGVTVSAVVPGFVRTEFHERMGVRTDTIPDPLWLDARQVVRAALAGAAKGRALVVPTLRYKVIVALSRMLPARVTAAGSLHPRDTR